MTIVGRRRLNTPNEGARASSLRVRFLGHELSAPFPVCSGRQGTRREEPGSVALTVEETEACTDIPLRTTMAHGAGGNTGATEAKVGGDTIRTGSYPKQLFL